MPRKRMQSKRRSEVLTLPQFIELMCGRTGRVSAFVDRADMREAWVQHREFLMADCLGCRPQGWWEFEAAQALRDDEPEAVQLARMGFTS